MGFQRGDPPSEFDYAADIVDLQQYASFGDHRAGVRATRSASRRKELAPIIKKMIWVADLEGVSPNEKLVLFILVKYADNTKNTCYPSQETVARKAGLARTTVVAVMKSLEAKGLIARRRRQEAGRRTSSETLLLVRRAVG